jgi:hypothetical protein
MFVSSRHSLHSPIPDDLSRTNGLQVGKAIRNQEHKVFEQHRPSTKNNNRDPSLPQILLVFKSAIDSQDNIEFCRLGRSQKLTVLKSSKARVSCCLTVMAGQPLAQSFVHALVEKNPHSRLGG